MEEYKLSDIAEVQTGPFGSQLHNEDYVTIGTPIVTVEHLGNRQFSKQNLPLVSDADKERLAKYILQEGDIVFSRVGSVDRCSYVSASENGWLFSGRCLRVRCGDSCYPLFLYYYFCNEPIKQYIKSIAVGATMPSINTKLMADIPIVLPNIENQKHIAAILSSIDDKIELNRRINGNLEQQAQTLFNHYFIERPDLLGKYKISNLTGIANYLNGLAMQKFRPQIEENGIPVLKIKELGQGYTDASSDICSENIADGYKVHNGDVIFSWSGTLMVKIWCGGLCGLNQHLFKVSSEIYPKWFYYFWTKHHLNKFIRIAQDKAVTMGHIKRGDLETSKILIPPMDILTKLNTIISPLFNQIIKKKCENKNLAMIRDTLLPRLMSGELKIDNLNR